jgi:aminoglycoside phosphotransferase (APT) family kinase protein
VSDALRARLETYLRRVWPEPAPVRVASLEQRTEGFSQETFFFEVECGAGPRRAFVAKREPPAGLLEPYDLEPEFRVLHALGDDPLPSPPAPWFESDPAALERPFYVMERLPGEVPLPAPQADGSPPFPEAERRSLAPQVVESLARLHALDWRARGFDFLGVPEPGAVAARELARWEERIRKSRLPVPPVLAEALGWLRTAPPAAAEIALLHGDFRLGNWLVEGRGGEATLTGILDWEMVHLGDPVEDLAWCTAPLWRGGTPWASALAPLDELVSLYERSAGRAVDRAALHWYHVLSVVKMSAIELTGIRAFLDGRTADLRMAVFDHQLPFLGALVAILRGWLPESLLGSA